MFLFQHNLLVETELRNDSLFRNEGQETTDLKYVKSYLFTVQPAKARKLTQKLASLVILIQNP